MRIPQHRNQSVDVHQFAMIPKSDIPRSAFDVQSTHKTAFDSGYLVPIYEDEVLPGDAHRLTMTGFVRMATPINPVMDNVYIETFFFFVPLRILWNHFVNMMGEQTNPGDSISYTTPQQVSPAGGYAVGSLQDYLGLPTVGQVGGGNTVSHSAFWTRAYNKIYNDWFRDENLINSIYFPTDDGPDTTPASNFVLQKRGKRKDYFTGALPWPQKGATAVSTPLAGQAVVKGRGSAYSVTGHPRFVRTDPAVDNSTTVAASGASTVNYDHAMAGTGQTYWKKDFDQGLYADLATATGVTINALRLSIQTQRVLEKDARGGTRYTEHVRQHFSVISPDARLQRSEYLGGGSAPINFSAIPQTTQSGLTGGSTPLGTLASTAAGLIKGHGFTQSFTEHGVILGIASVRADLTYQQGLRRMWSRTTRYSYYLPSFAMLGEQGILNMEIYCDGSANDQNVFGYIPQWDDMRYHPSKVTGLMRSTSASTIDNWHLAQKFTALPTLNSTFINEAPPLQRIMAVGAAAAGKELIADFFFNCRKARAMPMNSVPGMMDHF